MSELKDGAQILTDSEYLFELARFMPNQQVPEIKEHCDRLRQIAERLIKKPQSVDKNSDGA